MRIKTLLQRLNDWSEKFADKMSDWFGHPLFLMGNIILWILWIGVGIEHYPFGILTLLVSLEAIFMSILILNSSTRKGHADTKLMEEDISISHDVQETVDDIHDHITEIRTMLGEDDGK